MNLNPELNSFRVESGQPQRVYFDTTKIVTVGVNGDVGFIITNNTITSITIQSGLLTGHYFTLGTAFNFYSNNTIRYEGGSDMVDLDSNPIFDIDLQYIVNNLPEPAISRERYATVSGAGIGDGSLGNEWTLDEATNQAIAGDRVNVQKGDYSGGTFVVSNNGTLADRILFEGYDTNPGDSPSLARTQTTVLDGSKMPYFSGSGTGQGFNTNGKNYITVKNLIAENYNDGFDIGGGGPIGVIFDSVYARGSGTVNASCIEGFRSTSQNCRIINSYASDADAMGIRSAGDYFLVDNNYVCSNGTIDMDYYIVYGGSFSNLGESIIRNNELVRDPLSTHTGHGIDLRGNGIPVEYCLVEDNIIEYVGSAIELRTDTVQNCVVRNATVNCHQILSPDTTQAVRITGARNNIIDNVIGIDNQMFVQFVGSTESAEYGIDSPDTGNNNLFKNCGAYGTGGWQTYQVVRNAEGDLSKARTPQNNTFLNCNFQNVSRAIYYQRFYSTPHQPDIGNKFINTILTDFTEEQGGYQNETSDWGYDYTNTYNCWLPNGTPVSGTGNISIDPQYNPYPYAKNPGLEVGLWVDGNEYDLDGNQRTNPPTLGAADISTTPPDVKSIIITTTSSSASWTPQEVLNSGGAITWDVNGLQTQVLLGNNKPTFDLSAVVTPIVTGSSSTDFVGFTSLQLDQLDCTDIDITEALDLVKIDAWQNPIGTIDLTQNSKLKFLWFQDCSLTAFDLDANFFAESIYLDFNNLLDNATLDKIVNDLDSHGQTNGTLKIVDNTGHLTGDAQPAYDNLVAKGWNIDVSAPAQGSVYITWDNSTTPGVSRTIIYRDDIEIGSVTVNSPSQFTDQTPDSGVTHKYEVQAEDSQGISIDEQIGVNVINLPIP